MTALILLMSVTDRTWLGDEIFDSVPRKSIPPPTPAPLGVSFSSYTIAVPNRLALYFDQDAPAVRLRTIAAHPRVCEQLHETLRPYIDASRRRDRVWDAGATGGVAAIIGCAIPDILLLAGTITPGPAMLLQLALGPLGILVGLRVIDWAFPAFEIVEIWQRSRWQRTKSVFWQGVLFGLALLGVILTIVLSQPSGSTSCRCNTTTAAAGQP